MLRQYVVAAILWSCVFGEPLSAQTPAKVDFRRDVQPLFKTYCIGCHGPSQQMNNFRLDRRRDAMRGGTSGGAVIGPGNSAGSFLYLRLIGSQYGPQMPLTGPLSPEQINIIKAWIDQGAAWPDDVSGETPPSPPDPKATRVMEALRDGDRQAFTRMLREDPKVVNLKGPGGSTPLMYAALYGDSDSVRLLLEGGTDPNISNDAGATAGLTSCVGAGCSCGRNSPLPYKKAKNGQKANPPTSLFFKSNEGNSFIHASRSCVVLTSFQIRPPSDGVGAFPTCEKPPHY